MNAKSKALLSAVAMVLMLGCALVPLISTDSEIVAADDAQNDETEAFSISEIIESLLGIDELGLSDEAGYFFMPVKPTESEPTELDENITAVVEKNEAVTFKNNGEYTFSGEGQLVIGATGTLVLFSLEETNVSFSLIKNADSTVTDFIIMKPGSKISIFDMTFQLIASDDFSFISTSNSEVECVFTFSRDTSGHSEFRVGTNADMTLMGSLPFHISFDRDVIVASGSLTPISEGIGIVFSGSVSLQDLDKDKIDFLDKPLSIRFAVENFSFGYVVPDSDGDGTLVKLSASISTNDDIVLLRGRITIGGFALEIKDAAVNIALSGGTPSIEIVSPCSATLRLSDCSFVILNTKNFTLDLAAKDVIIGIETGDSPKRYDFGGNDPLELNGNISLAFVDANVAARYKNFDAMIGFSGDIKLDSMNIKLTDNSNWGITIEETEISGTLSSMAMGYSLPKNIIKEIGLSNLRIAAPSLLYGIESVTNVTEIEITKNGDTTVVGFKEFKSDFATVRGNSDWKGELEISALKVIGGNAASVEIGKVSLSNDIPMQQIFSREIPVQTAPKIDIGPFYDVLCIPTIELELSNLKYEGGTLMTFKNASFSVKNYRGLNEFFVKLEGDVKAAFYFDVETDKEETYANYIVSVSFSAAKISGFVNSSGKEENFSIGNNSSMAFNLYANTKTSIEDFLKIGASIEIIKGDAKFEGGLLPFVIEVDNGVKFEANGLTAFGFVLDKSVDEINGESDAISGIISIDTDAEFPLFFDEDAKSIKIGDDFVLALKTNGYVMTLNLDFSDEIGGTLVANHGFKLPKKFAGGGFAMTSGDQKTGSFTVGTTGANVSMGCGGEKYYLTCEGATESTLYEYGSSITLPMSSEVRKDLEFYGWSDGTAIYKPFDVFTMPSHDVVLKPVFVKNVIPSRTTEGSRIVLVVEAPNADMVKVNINDINWDILRVTVGNTTFVIDEKTFEKQCCGNNRQVTKKYIVLQSVATALSSGRDAMCYDVGFYTVDKDVLSGKDVLDSFGYSENTLFGTTVNVRVNGDVKNFNVFEIDDKGNRVAVDGVTYAKRSDGTYDVSFTISHAACYAVEPVYENTLPIGAIVGIVIILACAVGIGYYLIRRSRSS